MDDINVTDRFDGAAHWAALPEDVRAEIGAVALERIASDYLADRAYDDDHARWERAADASSAHCDALLKDLFVEAIPREALEAPDGAPRIPSLLGMVCRVCACSQNDGCAEGCAWAEDSLCTRHAAAAAGAAAERSAP